MFTYQTHGTCDLYLVFLLAVSTKLSCSLNTMLMLVQEKVGICHFGLKWTF